MTNAHRKVTIWTRDGSYRGVHWIRVRGFDQEHAEVSSIRQSVFAMTGEFPIADWEHA